MKKIFLINSLIFFFVFFFCSCYSIKTRPIKKKIRTNSKFEKGDLLYENNLAVVHFDRELALKALNEILEKQKMSDCDRKRLVNCIENIEKGNIFIFETLTNPWNIYPGDFYESFKNWTFHFLLLKGNFSILNKSTGVFEKYLTYNRNSSLMCCCNVYFKFPNGDTFITTSICTDFIIVVEDECDE